MTNWKFNALGTSWLVQGEVDVRTKKKVLHWLSGFEAKYSRFIPNSYLNQMSKQPGIYEQGKEIMELWSWYAKMYGWTDGKFTPMIGKNLEEIGYNKEYSFNKEELLSFLPKWDEALGLEIDNVVTKQRIQLDLGGAGKGWAVDRVAGLLRDNLVTDFAVNAGGDIFLSKLKDEKVALENPTNTGEAIGIAMISHGSICGSASSRRKWGKYHHIFDPSKQESPQEIIATWVVAKNAMIADTLATCLFLIPAEKLIDKIDFEYLILNQEMKIKKSLNMPVELFYAQN